MSRASALFIGVVWATGICLSVWSVVIISAISFGTAMGNGLALTAWFATSSIIVPWVLFLHWMRSESAGKMEWRGAARTMALILLSIVGGMLLSQAFL